MKPSRAITRLIPLAVLTMLILALGIPVHAAPVVVELFESQGCSSCPPAERVMQQLHQSFGAEVILLTCHVDYWDQLGWTDTFSYPPCTDRQKAYARAFGQDTIYTPELVIQGEVGFNGSDLEQAQTEIRARQRRTAPLLNPLITSRTREGAIIEVRLPPQLSGSIRHLTVIAYENGPSVRVLRGENTGTTMGGDFAVRSIREMPQPIQGTSVVTLHLDTVWDIQRMGFVVLARGDSPGNPGGRVCNLQQPLT